MFTEGCIHFCSLNCSRDPIVVPAKPPPTRIKHKHFQRTYFSSILSQIRSVSGNSPPYSVRSYRVRDLHVGTSDERRSWFYATSVHILVRRPGFDLLFDKTGVENPILQIVSSCHQNTESEGARATPRAISAEYNPTYSQSTSQINIMLKSHAASIAM